MNNSCNLIGRRRNRTTNKLTDKLSLLHQDLLSIGKNNQFFDRKKANRAFFLSLSKKFLNEYDDELILDSEDIDAEPTIASFYEVAKSTMPEVKLKDIRDLLAKKFGEGVYTFELALDKMTTFNKEMYGAHTFMGTIRRLDNGKYKFEVTYNAKDEQDKLMQVLADKNFIDIVTKKLNDAGIGIEESKQSNYSTEHYNTLSKGLLGLIKLKNGENITTDLAKETGHAIIGMLGEDHPFIKRLTTIAEQHPEIFELLLGEDEWVAIRDLPEARRTREALGHLLAKYLEDLKNIDNLGIKKSLKNLFDRIISYIKTKLPFTDREYNLALYDAKYISYKTVRDFLGPNFQGTLENALNTKETLEADNNAPLAELNNIIKLLDLLANYAKDWGYSTFSTYKEKVSDIMTQYHKISDLAKESDLTVADNLELHKLTAKELIKAIRFIVDRADEALTELAIANSGRNPYTGAAIEENEICRIIKKNQVLYDELDRLLHHWNNMIDKFTAAGENEDFLKRLNDVKDSINEVLAPNYMGSSGSNINYSTLISNARLKQASRLLARINGNEFLIIEKHVSVDSWKVVRHSDKLVDLKEELFKSDIDPPLQWFSRYINAMADSPSIINTLVSALIEEQKHKANVETLNDKDKLFNLYQKLRAYGISSTSMFMEVDDDGELTGNIISERNWGEWEKRKKKAYLEWREKWWESNKNLFKDKGKIEAYNDVVFLDAKHYFLKDWHSKNSSKVPVLDSEGKHRTNEDGEPLYCYAPAINKDEYSSGKTLYEGKLFNALNNSNKEKDKAAISWLEEYMELKRKLDSRIPIGATNLFGVRAPLFLGTLANKLHGSLGGKYSGGQHIKRVAGTTWSHFVILKLSESPGDTEYGGENDTYNEEDVVDGNTLIFTAAHSNAINSIKRVPLYGVRKLLDLHTISTDLIHSTLAYSAMANNYNCLQSVIYEVEVLNDQLKYLKVRTDLSNMLRFTHNQDLPGVYCRMQDYLNLQVYNTYAPIDLKKTWRWLRKLTGALAKYGSLYFLKFNIHSSITNLFTGINEIIKEAIGGESYNPIHLCKATGIFLGYVLVACKNGFFNQIGITGIKGSDNSSMDYMNLFLTRFDAQNENERIFRDYHILTSGYQVMRGYKFTNIAMFPYDLTDKFMQSIAYIATALNTELINKNGEKSSVWDAYVIKGRHLELKTITENGKEVDAEWKIVDKNLKLLNDYFENKYSDSEIPTDKLSAIYLIGERGEKIKKSIYIPWDEKAESRFKVTCRRINNRMHGVYNRDDSGAFIGSLAGPAFASLKKYAIGLIDKRFSRGRYDPYSRIWRQGTAVTVGNLLIDYLFSTDKRMFTVKNKAIDGAINMLVGTVQFMAIFASGALGAHNILRRRGYSDHLIANIRRMWADQLIPEVLRCLLYITAPPEERDETQKSLIINTLIGLGVIDKREKAEKDKDPWLPIISEYMLKFAVGTLKSAPWPISEMTEDDKKYLNETYLTKQSMKYEGTIPFSIKGMIHYQCYRLLMEQDAYNIANPFSAYNLFSEYKNLTNSSIIGFSALYDTSELLTLIFGSKSKEELKELTSKERKGYTASGDAIYTRGVWKHFKKSSVHAAKTSVPRSLMTYMFPYTSKDNMAFWRSRALGLEEKK